MEIALILKSILSLVFVLGLMLLSLWLVKYCYVNFSNHKLIAKLSYKTRIKIVETKRLDARNNLVIVECDDVEYLVVASQGQPLLLKEKKVKKEKLDEA